MLKYISMVILSAGLLLAAATLSPGQTAATSTAPAENKLRILAPGMYKELADNLISNYTKNRGSLPFAINGCEGEAVAVDQLLAGADVVIWRGKISDKATAAVAIKWGAMQPKFQVLGGRCVVLAVHATSPLKAVTLEQAKSILSGKVNNWKALGGADKPIRRYGTMRPDPMANLINDKLLPTASWAAVTNRKTTSDILDTLSTDPQGFAFIDFTEASTRNNTVRILGIGPADKPVLPTAQSVKDGSYPLAEVVMLYTSNKTSAKGKELADFVLSGECDGICRKMGFVPGLRAVRSDIIATFEKLYGADVKKVAATPEPDDDIALAKEIINAAKTTDLDPDLLTLMCDKAYEVVSNVAGGGPTALSAMQVLMEKLPAARFHCAMQIADMLERMYVADKKPETAEPFLGAAFFAMDLATREGQHQYALELVQKAVTVATETKSSNLEYVKQQASILEARQAVLKELPDLLAKLDTNPADMDSRAKVIWINLVDCDNPSEAAKFLDTNSKSEMLTNIPLVLTPADKLSEESAFTLAEWYLGLADKAGPAGKILMLRRSQAYYQQFFALHKGKDRDSLAVRAELGSKKVDTALEGFEQPKDLARASAQVVKVPLAGDLLPKIDLAAATVAGKFEKAKGGIVPVVDKKEALLALPGDVSVPCDVTVTLQLDKLGGMGVSIPCEQGRINVLFLLDKYCLLYLRPGDKDQKNNVPLKNIPEVGKDIEVRCVAKMKDKQLVVDTYLNGNEVLHWTGSPTQLDGSYSFKTFKGESIGLLFLHGGYVIKSVAVRQDVK